MTATEVDTKKIVIEPVSRIEGHGKVTLILDDDNRVSQARFHVVEFRGFERFIQGRPFWEMPVVVQRLCGICPVSHHLAAAKATDILVGVDQISPTAEKMRRLMHLGQTFQSHALHFFHLASPDLLFGFDAPAGERNVINIINKNPDLAVQAVLMRKYGQEIIKATDGKKIHGTGAIPGGINKSLSDDEKAFLLKDIDQMLQWSIESVELIKGVHTKLDELMVNFAAFPSNHVSLVREDGALDLYHGVLRAKDPQGEIIFDQVDYSNYLDYINEEVRSWSYMKFPFIKSLGKKNGWYRVGPLARINNCDFIPTPLAEEQRQVFMKEAEKFGSTIVNSTLHYHWARLIELLHAAEGIRDLLNDPDIQGDELIREGERRHEAVGLIEAPRGTLFHHYRTNEYDQVTMANLIVSTTNNNEPMNQAVQRVAEQYFDGREITEGLLNHIEVAIRAYDPCLSCATHAVGKMPLEVILRNSDGMEIDRAIR